MKKRLRKKYRTREFTEYAFEFLCPAAFETHERIYDLCDFIDSIDCCVSGSGQDAYVDAQRGSVTAAQRTALIQWCEQHGWQVQASALTDQWLLGGKKGQPGNVHPRN